MQITEIRSFPVAIPLRSPVSFSNRTLFYRDQGVTVFDDVVADPLVPDDGVMVPADRPGHGVTLDADVIEEFCGMPEI